MPMLTKAKTCGHKQQHATRDRALGHMGMLIRKRGASPVALNVYRCRHCHTWHVGHRRTRAEDR